MLPQENEPINKRILSFDPGSTTGISYLENGNFRFGLIAVPAMFGSEDFLASLAKICKPTTILIEEPPRGGFPSKDQTFVVETISRWYSVAGFNVHVIMPAQWKKLVESSGIDANSHIRDATDMAKWYFNSITGIK
jgi:hypothetical protein